MSQARQFRYKKMLIRLSEKSSIYSSSVYIIYLKMLVQDRMVESTREVADLKINKPRTTSTQHHEQDGINKVARSV